MGINSIGKSTQVKLLKDRMLKDGNRKYVEVVKYPFYDIEPIGPMLNDYLRNGNPFGLTAREFQTLQAMHRVQVQPLIFHYLERGHNVIAEDYTGTGIAWGIGAGVDKEYLLKINEGLLKEDVPILLDGDRFLEGKESGHTHEEDDKLIKEVRAAHLHLAQEFDWHIVIANAPKQTVHEHIWDIAVTQGT